MDDREDVSYEESHQNLRGNIRTEGRESYHRGHTECPYEEGSIFYKWFMEGRRMEHEDPIFSARW